jgi:GH25 family lysozyme M1 (1,4-beta-N-acetylmuramidase)
MPLFGVDVSRHQGTALDWGRIRTSGIEFMIARASIATRPDARYAANVTGARAAGIPVVGAYHFLYPAHAASPIEQARAFVCQIGDADGLLTVLDVEKDRSPTTGEVFKPTIADARAFATEFARLTDGHPLVVYGPAWYWKGTLGNPPAADLGPLHASRYVPVSMDAAGRPIRMTPTEAFAKVPAAWWKATHGGWTEATILQFTSTGRVDGYAGRIDLNAYRGSLDALAALTRKNGLAPREDDVRITAIKGEDWLPTVSGGQSNGVLRDLPDRALPIVVRVEAGTIVRSIAEVETSAAPPDNRWRLTEHAGKPAYMLRMDWTPLVPGGDPLVDEALNAYIERR